MKVTVLGCGTSGGVPKAPEYWGQCDPANPRNRRSRASVHVTGADGTSILFDTSPDLRTQVLDNGITRLDGVFLTHDHADHVHGIDDLRGFFHVREGVPVPVHGTRDTMDVVTGRFNYVFHSQTGYPAIAEARIITPGEPVSVGDLTVTAFEQQHGPVMSLGLRVGDVAYSTDVETLPESAFEALAGVKVWIVDALRRRPHPTHAHLDRTLDWIARLRPERAILTHMDWSMDYDTLRRELPDGVEPGFDGLCVTV
ncbi:MBL fold metallo-hydrolase [Yunchengibacter salinarum]|uniref:MBL fold metallo-hydrolase n=1 Tax=Yunchengibacter salinarum TaxID=3133399 RepID=UPI0035B57111